MHKAFLFLGSNIDTHIYIPKSLTLLYKIFNVIDCTDIYKTQSTVDPDKTFSNWALLIQTELAPIKIKEELLKIEVECDRKRTHDKNADRTLDIDLCLYGDQVIKTQTLHLPDPHLFERYFMAKILSLLDPEYVIPGTQQTLNILQASFDPKLHSTLSFQKSVVPQSKIDV